MLQTDSANCISESILPLTTTMLTNDYTLSHNPPVVSVRGASKRSRSNDDQNINDDDVDLHTNANVKRSRLLDVYSNTVSPKEVNCGNEIRKDSSEIDTVASESFFKSESSTDIVEKTNYNLVIIPFTDASYTSGIAPYDTPSKGKIQEAPEYVTDIFQRLYHAEVSFLQIFSLL
jgi:hypothetical protein